MTKSLFSKLLLIALSLFISQPKHAHASPGGSEAHGGNAVTISFLSAAEFAQNSLEKWGDSVLPAISRAKLTTAILKTTLLTEPRVCLDLKKHLKVACPLNFSLVPDVVEKDAINIPGENKIFISESRWSKLKGETLQQASVALHEYLGIMGVEYDSASVLSSAFIQNYQFREILAPRNAIEEEIASIQSDFQQGRIPNETDLKVSDPDHYITTTSWDCREDTDLVDFSARTVSLNSKIFIHDLSTLQVLEEKGRFNLEIQNSQNSITQSITLPTESLKEYYRVSDAGDLLILKESKTLTANEKVSPFHKDAGVVSWSRCSPLRNQFKEQLQRLYGGYRAALNYDLTPSIQTSEDILENTDYKICVQTAKAKNCLAIEPLMDQVLKNDLFQTEIAKAQKINESVTKFLRGLRDTTLSNNLQNLTNELTLLVVTENNSLSRTLYEDYDKKMTACHGTHKGAQVECQVAAIIYTFKFAAPAARPMTLLDFDQKAFKLLEKSEALFY